MDKRANIEELQADAELLREKLEELRGKLKKTPPIIPCDSGSGQRGYKEHPIFTVYEKTLKSYLATLKQLESLTGENRNDKQDATSLPFKSKWKMNKDGRLLRTQYIR